MNRCTHPNGTTFEWVPPYYIHKDAFGVLVKHGKRPAGVRITLPDGTKIFRTNEYYQDFNTKL